MRNTPKPILIILALILIAVAVGLVYDLQNFLQDIPEVRDNPMLLAGWLYSYQCLWLWLRTHLTRTDSRRRLFLLSWL